MTTIPAGVVVAFAGDNIPDGWLLCDGRSLNKDKYPDLFKAIGAIHGGDANPDFKLPNYCGMFLRGVNHGRGFDPDAADRVPPARDVPGNPGNNGDQVGSIQAGALENHSHGVGVNAGDSLSCAASGGNYRFPNYLGDQYGGGSQKTTENAGGKETRPVNAYVEYIIKY